MPAPSEFYAPLSATGGHHQAEPGPDRARQLHALVRPPPGDQQPDLLRKDLDPCRSRS